MKKASLVARYLLGLIFTVVGLNGFLQFIPAPAVSGASGQFMGALVLSHYFVVIFLIQLIAGVLLLANRFVPLALAMLGPIIVNIFFFHALMLPSGMPMAIIVVILWLLVARSVSPVFAAFFQPRVAAN